VTATIWRPLLDGDLAAEAWDAVRGIAEALTAWPPDGDEITTEGSKPAYSLSGGAAGLAIFYGYLAKTEDAGASLHSARAITLLDSACDALATTPMGPDLYAGFTGVAWVVEHASNVLGLIERDDGAAGEDISEQIDESLLNALSVSWAGDYDLILGLVGFGVYALERDPPAVAWRPSLTA
jgi:lantibiotic biosynthesis protein